MKEKKRGGDREKKREEERERERGERGGSHGQLDWVRLQQPACTQKASTAAAGQAAVAHPSKIPSVADPYLSELLRQFVIVDGEAAEEQFVFEAGIAAC